MLTAKLVKSLPYCTTNVLREVSTDSDVIEMCCVLAPFASSTLTGN